MELKKCKICNKIIQKEPNRSWNQYKKKKFCSRNCSSIYNSQKITVNCFNCNKDIHRSPSHVKPKNYCSQKCRRKSKTFICEVCHKKFIKKPSERICNHIYCSKKCQGIAKRKNNKQNQGRRSPEDLEWKKSILKRDNYTCQMCDSNSDLEAHHIKPIKDFPELRHDINNGLCVCHDCHYYGIHKGMPNFIHGRYSKQH